MNNQPVVLAFKDFLADFEKQDNRQSRFSIVLLYFTLRSLPWFVMATVLIFLGIINCYKRLLEKGLFEDVFVHWLNLLNLLLLLCNKYYYIDRFLKFSV